VLTLFNSRRCLLSIQKDTGRAALNYQLQQEQKKILSGQRNILKIKIISICWLQINQISAGWMTCVCVCVLEHNFINQQIAHSEKMKVLDQNQTLGAHIYKEFMMCCIETTL
jgi:hypothetical protein